MVNHEHVANFKVKVGDKVKARQEIAEVGAHGTESNFGVLGVSEIDIFEGLNTPDDITHYCPFLYLYPSVKESIYAKVNQLIKDWEAYKGDTSIYDETKYIVPGCLYEKLSEKEALGN